MWEKVKKYKFIAVFTIVFAIIVIPIIIHFIFKINLNIELLVAEWSAGEFLEYYGNTLSFIGTIILSILALWQNHEIKVESEKHNQMLEKMQKIRNTPRFVGEKRASNKDNRNLEIILKNATDNLAYEVKAYDFTMLDKENKIKYNYKKTMEKSVIQKDDYLIIQLNNPQFTDTDYLNFKVECWDEFLIKHQYKGEIRTIEGNIIIVIRESERIIYE